jgi:uncharacterized protein YabE (DUF348 family)
MVINERNSKIIKEIINILAENNCTVSEAIEILDYITQQIPQGATVKRAKIREIKLLITGRTKGAVIMATENDMIIEQKDIVVEAGQILDLDTVVREVMLISEKYSIKTVLFDYWYSMQLVLMLENAGLTVKRSGPVYPDGRPILHSKTL